MKILKLEKLQPRSSDIVIDVRYNGKSRKMSIDDFSFYKRKITPLPDALKSRGYEIDSQWVEFVNAIDLIGNAIIQNNLLHWDLHVPGNIMCRSDNTIVISDPISGGAHGYSLVQYGRVNDKTVKGNTNIKP